MPQLDVCKYKWLRDEYLKLKNSRVQRTSRTIIDGVHVVLQNIITNHSDGFFRGLNLATGIPITSRAETHVAVIIDGRRTRLQSSEMLIALVKKNQNVSL